MGILIPAFAKLKKKMKKISTFILLAALTLSFSACSSNDDNVVIDTEKPTITSEGIVAMPINCQTYELGSEIPVRYILKDNVELGNYNIEIHNNFNHHTHSTDAGDCRLDPMKDAAANVWVFNHDYTIPAGSKTYKIEENIKIPADRQPGDYHFMIRFTDAAGHQELKAVSIKLIKPVV